MNLGRDCSATGRELDFVGRVTASATHEIKNELAVINEQSRLVLEFLEMAASGKEISLERLHGLISRVVARVGQADAVVKRLNVFAHSTELERTACEAVSLLELMVQMFGRMAGLKRVSLELSQEHPAAVELTATPLQYEQVLWSCMSAALAAAQPSSILRLHLERDDEILRLSLKGEMTGPPQAPPAELLDLLGASVLAGPGSLNLEIPLNPPPEAKEGA
ncbi:MAG: hypothetical protein KJ720_04555 [Proteobacteria bacterium]|nr:hypothetical protein [Pseudomonadota bacterium]MBU1452127.1 hypothetical protein [Pseudomonadota bacterium]MBU2467522.1 hypothetical protein [Pseudomonadota bacterium]MBU2517927.1 hypothetical protein [Pseudomonadota bacterium]